jgi:glycosyltransferase involved in cell wall biosynthesis
MPPVAAALRAWDRRTSHRVDRFVAISRFVAARIQAAYARAAEVIYPPVDLARFTPGAGAGAYYLVVSALVPYKRVDLAVAAATALRRRLLVVGTGPEEARLRAAAGPSVEFLGWRGDGEVAELYTGCRAVLFPSVEDFGIVPLEAMAAGRPVIALGVGGAAETVVPVGTADGEAPTGVFFHEQSVPAVIDAMRTFEDHEARFDPKALRARAEPFDRPIFRDRIATCLREALAC